MEIYILPKPFILSYILNISTCNQEVQILYDRVRLDITAWEIHVPITKASRNKLRLHQGEYSWADTGVIINYDEPNMLYLLFKIINLDTRIGVLNLKDEIEKATLAEFGNNVKDLLDDMSLNYSIIIDEVERHKDYVRHIFRYILSGNN